MGEPRPEKVAVVTEVRERFTEADGVILTEYRGLDVPSIAQLRRSLREAGGEYKIYKNSLVRFAVQELGLEIEDLLIGPTAIAFIGEKADGSPGDAAGVARALKDFARTNDSLIVKGGLLDDKMLSVDELRRLAELPPLDVMLAQLAGAFQAPMAKFAGLLQALPRDFAYGLQALIEKQGGVPATAEPAIDVPEEEAVADTAEASSDGTEASETEASSDGTEASDTEASEEAGQQSDTEESASEEAGRQSDTEESEETMADQADDTAEAAADAEQDQEN